MNFMSIMRQLNDIKGILSYELAFKRKEEHLENALWALNLCIDHLIAFKNEKAGEK